MCEKTFGENCKYQIPSITADSLFCYKEKSEFGPGQLVGLNKCEASTCPITNRLFNGNNPYLEKQELKTPEEISKDEELTFQITKLYNFMEFLVSEENITENSYNMIVDLMNSIFEIEA